MLPPSTAGPRTLNQSLAAAAAHIRSVLAGGCSAGRQGAAGGQVWRESWAHALASSPTTGMAVLDRDWKIVEANGALEKFFGGAASGLSLRGVGLASLVSQADLATLVQVLTQLSRNTSPGGDSIAVPLRFAAFGRYPLNEGRPIKVCTHAHARAHTHTHAVKHARTHACTHTHTHTHTHRWTSYRQARARAARCSL